MFKLVLEKEQETLVLVCTVEKAKEYKKEVSMCSTDYNKALNCVNHFELWNILGKLEFHNIFLSSCKP